MAAIGDMKPHCLSLTNERKLNNNVVDNDKNTEFHYLAACGQTDKISRDLVVRQRIDIENYLGWTALMMACKNGYLETVKLLLDMGSDPSKKNKFGASVFLISVSSGNLNIVKLVLQQLLCGGISKRSLQSVFSPLSIAIIFGNHNILQYLIQHQFDVNGTIPHTGVTPLMFATAMDDEQSFDILIANKADSSIKNYSGITAMDIRKIREVKEETQFSKPMKAKQLTPAELISNSPYMTPFTKPASLLSSQPSFCVWTPEQMVFHHIRKSSNTGTPQNCLLTTPHLTPIGTMAFVPQIFFPPDFVPVNVSSNAGIYRNTFSNSYEILNSRVNSTQMNQSTLFFSPLCNPNTSFLSPCI